MRFNTEHRSRSSTRFRIKALPRDLTPPAAKDTISIPSHSSKILFTRRAFHGISRESRLPGECARTIRPPPCLAENSQSGVDSQKAFRPKPGDFPPGIRKISA